MATLNTLTDNTRTKLVIDPQKDIWTDSELKLYINEGITRFYAKASIKEAYKDGSIALLVDQQSNYTKPADLRRLLWAKVINKTYTDSTANEVLLLTDVTDNLADFQKTHEMDADGDCPQYIYEEDGELWLYPVPNSNAVTNYSIEYKYSERPAVLGDTDTPDIPTEWQFIFEDYAVWRAWNKLPDKENEAVNAKAIWEENWRQAMQDIVLTSGERVTWKMPVLPKKNKK